MLYTDEIKEKISGINSSLVKVIVDGEDVGILPKIDLVEQINRSCNWGHKRIGEIIIRNKVNKVGRNIDLKPATTDELFAEAVSSTADKKGDELTVKEWVERAKKAINESEYKKPPMVSWTKEHGLLVNGKRPDTGETREEYLTLICDKAWDVIYKFDLNQYTCVCNVKTVAAKKGIEGLKEHLGDLAVKKVHFYEFGRDRNSERQQNPR